MSKADKTKEFIIEKTAPIFNMKGYAGTSLTDLTQITGLTKGSIYGNFTGKDEVALAVFDYNWQKVANAINAEMSLETTAKGQLLSYINVFNNFLDLFPQGGCPVLNTAVDADDTHPQLKQKACDAFMSWKNKITDIIEKGIENHEFNPEIDPEQMALTIIAMIEGGIMIAKLTGKLNYQKAVIKSMQKLIDELK